jgi:hypothetical protein
VASIWAITNIIPFHYFLNLVHILHKQSLLYFISPYEGVWLQYQIIIFEGRESRKWYYEKLSTPEVGKRSDITQQTPH